MAGEQQRGQKQNEVTKTAAKQAAVSFTQKQKPADTFESDVRDLSDQEFKRVYEDALDWESAKTVTERQKKQYKDIMAEAMNRGIPVEYVTLDEARAPKAKNVNEVTEAPKNVAKVNQGQQEQEQSKGYENAQYGVNELVKTFKRGTSRQTTLDRIALSLTPKVNSGQLS